MTTTGLKIKSLITLNNLTINDVADKLGITPPTLRARFKDSNFRYVEICTLIDLLNIENPQDVFFQC